MTRALPLEKPILAYEAGLALRKDRDDAGCMVALFPDEETAAKIASIAAASEPAEALHVTLAYLGTAGPDTDHDPVTEVARGWAQATPPVEATISGAGAFTQGEQPVLYASVDAPGLEDHRQHLARALAAAGHPPSSEHGFTPHMTLAYGGTEVQNAAAELGGTELKFDRVAVVHQKDREDFPLTGVQKVETFSKPGTADVTAEDLKRLRPLLEHYRKSPKPFTSCKRDQLKHGLSEGHANRRCAVIADLIHGGTDWRGRGKVTKADSAWTPEVVEALDRVGEALDKAKPKTTGAVRSRLIGAGEKKRPAGSRC